MGLTKTIGILVSAGILSCCGCLGVAQETKPVSIDGWHRRAEKALAEGKADQAIREMDEVIQSLPSNANLHIIRGSLKFRSGRIEDSLVDFDKVIELEPHFKPELWQRGIALYYAGKYKEGLDQFSIHRDVNPNDVENAFWHFMCNAKLKGVEAAQKDVLLAGFDRRVPLMQVQQLILGKGTVEEVIAACEKDSMGTQGQKLSQFYGYLYVGLYYDVLGDAANAEKYMQKCVDQNTPSYMYDVAKLHLSMLKNRTMPK
jgi:lipoprotein NlpI